MSCYCLGRSPHGERGLKSPRHAERAALFRRSPHGERGLKSIYRDVSWDAEAVAPLTGSVD